MYDLARRLQGRAQHKKAEQLYRECLAERGRLSQPGEPWRTWGFVLPRLAALFRPLGDTISYRQEPHSWTG